VPIDYKKYPLHWKLFSLHIRFDRAQGRCECEDECGADHKGRCKARHGQFFWSFKRFFNGEMLKRSMIVLTVAHLWKHTCDCENKCAIPSHVKAMCQDCHLRYDVEERAEHARATRQQKKDGLRSLLRLMR
jgi:hypothetical protein